MARRRPRYVWAAAAAVWVGAVAAGQWLGRTAGSTRAERRQVLPGDELVDHPTVVTNHAITIPAPPDRLWPWLVQMGWHRGGWYTARWVDRLLFPANWPSATELVPELQRPLAVGDRIPDGPPDTAWFVIEHVNPPHLLVLHSTTHLPAAWRARLGVSIDWAWTFTLADAHNGGTRLQLRVRGQTKPWWLTATYVAALVPADYIMAHSMLVGIRRRVHRQVASTADGSRPWARAGRRGVAGQKYQFAVVSAVCGSRMLSCPVDRVRGEFRNAPTVPVWVTRAAWSRCGRPAPGGLVIRRGNRDRAVGDRRVEPLCAASPTII